MLKTSIDAALSLYAVYSITPSMNQELHVKMRSTSTRAARNFGYLTDAQDFYQEGPGILEAAPITYKMSQGSRRISSPKKMP